MEVPHATLPFLFWILILCRMIQRALCLETNTPTFKYNSIIIYDLRKMIKYIPFLNDYFCFSFPLTVIFTLLEILGEATLGTV